MGWWGIEDGTDEMVGDGPADQLGTALEQSLGETFDDDLFTGFLVAFTGVMRRNPAMLLAHPEELEDTTVVASFADREPIRVPVPAKPAESMLADTIHEALDGIAMQYRDTNLERPPTLRELLLTLAFVTRGRIVDADDGHTLELKTIRAQHGDGEPSDQTLHQHADALRWGAVRTIAATTPPPSPAIEAMVAAALGDTDWRVRMTAVLAVGRCRLSSLAGPARAAPVPGTDVGLRDADRRALLALRDVAAERAQPGGPQRPIHPDPQIAASRAAFLAEVTAVVTGEHVPASDSPAYVLHALEAPDEAASEPLAPALWQRWLGPRCV